MNGHSYGELVELIRNNINSENFEEFSKEFARATVNAISWDGLKVDFISEKEPTDSKIGQIFYIKNKTKEK
ncbi:MAG: hypothetical protein AABY32_04985 [Nanoarchaeota archaeon]